MASASPSVGYGFDPQRVSSDLAQPTLVSFLDMARWLAAAMVVLAHLRAMLLLGYPTIASDAPPLWIKAWYFLTGSHGEAVIIFFVLSGFLVGGLSAARAQTGAFDTASYAIDRFSRLFIAFVPAILLTWVLDSIGASLLGGTGIYDGTHPMVIEKVEGQVFEDGLGLTVLLGNLAMLQSYFLPVLGSNDPLWTLSTEFWFYVVFGALLTGFVRGGYARIAFGLVALVACLALGSYFIAWFGVWVMGFVCATIRPGRTGHWLVPLTILLGWLAVMRWYAPQISESMAYIFVADYILALCFCWVILAMRTARLKLLERIARFNKAMADFSYSLYLIHHPVIMFLIALLGITTGMAGFATGFDPTQTVAPAFYVGLTVAIFLLSWLFAQATERHTGRLRKFLKQRLLG